MAIQRGFTVSLQCPSPPGSLFLLRQATRLAPFDAFASMAAWQNIADIGNSYGHTLIAAISFGFLTSFPSGHGR